MGNKSSRSSRITVFKDLNSYLKFMIDFKNIYDKKWQTRVNFYVSKEEIELSRENVETYIDFCKGILESNAHLHLLDYYFMGLYHMYNNLFAEAKEFFSLSLKSYQEDQSNLMFYDSFECEERIRFCDLQIKNIAEENCIAAL